MSKDFDRDYFYGKIKSNYSDYKKIDFNKQFRTIIHFIKKNQITGKFLDVGCAFGFLVKLVFPYFEELHGVDISHFAIENSKKICSNANFQIANIENGLFYPDEYFDCITALDVIEHTSSIEVSLKNIVTKLKKGGYLVISLPIMNFFRKKLSFLDKDRTHFSIPKERYLLKLINKNNLVILKKRYFLPSPIFYKIYNIPIEIELFLRKY